MPFLNLNTFSALFIVPGMAFQRVDNGPAKIDPYLREFLVVVQQSFVSKVC